MPYVLENELAKVEVVEKAAEIQHFFDKENNVEIMYQGDEGWSGKNPSLFPIIGSTYSKSYEIDGKTYTMKNHGLARYATFDIEKVSEDTLVCTFQSSQETLAQYPFDFIFKISYVLEKKTLHIHYEITNTSDKEMPYSFGLHPAFKVDNFDEYSIDFENKEEATQLITDPTFEKNIEYQKVQLDSWKLSYEDIEKYATIIYKDYTSTYVTLSKNGEGKVRVYFPGYPFLAIWTHPTRSHFICIEPWYGHADFEKETPDFYHREGTMILQPGDVQTFNYDIEIL